jgi:hypothetical protein
MSQIRIRVDVDDRPTLDMLSAEMTAEETGEALHELLHYFAGAVDDQTEVTFDLPPLGDKVA